jgi:hypothetical protein
MISALGSGGRHTGDSATELLKFYNPLGPRDMRALFPDAALTIERPMGVAMSLIASREAVPTTAGVPVPTEPGTRVMAHATSS